MTNQSKQVLTAKKVEELILKNLDGGTMGNLVQIVRATESKVIATLQAAGAAEPQPMNETQLLVGVDQLAPVLDEAVLRNKTWKHAALTFVKSAISIRDAMWRHTLAAHPQPAPAGDAGALPLDIDRVLGLADEHADESREDGCRVLDRGGLHQFAKDVWRIAHAIPTPQRPAGDAGALADDMRKLLQDARWRIANLSRSAVPFDDPLDGPVLRALDAALASRAGQADTAGGAVPDLLAACENARDMLATDRQAFVDCQRLRDIRTEDPIAHGLVAVEDGVWITPEDAEALRDYDRAIALIDAAITKAGQADTGSTSK